MLILAAHLLRLTEQRAEASFQHRIAINLAADVADDPAKPCPQELELAPNAFELVSELERLRSENAALKKGASEGVRMKKQNPTTQESEVQHPAFLQNPILYIKTHSAYFSGQTAFFTDDEAHSGIEANTRRVLH
jgi:hypothetical protein